jgi:hypothetical protein
MMTIENLRSTWEKEILPDFREEVARVAAMFDRGELAPSEIPAIRRALDLINAADPGNPDYLNELTIAMVIIGTIAGCAPRSILH